MESTDKNTGAAGSASPPLQGKAEAPTGTPQPSRPGFRLTRVKIQNFRCIKDLTLELDEITVLIGENNSGKTAVLKAIERCLGRWRGSSSRVFDDYDYHLANDTASPEEAERIKIELQFLESAPEIMPAELRADLVEVLVLREDRTRQVTLRVTSAYDSAQTDFVTDFVFLNADEEPMKLAAAASLAVLRRAFPVHFLSALRDAERHFAGRRPFWREFLSANELSKADRVRFEKEMAELNQELIGAHPPLREVRDHLNSAGEVIAFGKKDPVTVDALPARASALLSQARVNMASRQGAKIPLDRQGEGAQSLAVLLLFEAFLQRRLGGEGEAVQPITILEEPEAHLHPTAVRMLMEVVKKFPGQKILSTHSGDLIGGLDPASVRRLAHRDGQVRAYPDDLESMDAKDMHTFQRKISRGNGDLLFARCWLVYEGETEAVLFRGVADALGINLDQNGVAMLQCSEISPDSLFRMANRFGIPWFFVFDDDAGRPDYEKSAMANLQGVPASDRYAYPYPCIEDYLRDNGFCDIYKEKLRKRQKVNAARQVVERIKDNVPVPETLKWVVKKAVALARA